MERRRNDETWVAAVKQEYLALRAIPGKAKEAAALVTRYAKMHGIDRSSLFRKMKLNICKRTPDEAVELSQKRIDAHALDVWNYQRARSRDGAEWSTANAYTRMREQNLIPQEVTLDMVYQSINRQNLRMRAIAVPKMWERETPYSLVQIDYTVSRYFKNGGDGYAICVDPRFTYKNTEEEERVWMAQVIDDASRVMYGEYIFTKGESLEMVHNFLHAAFREKQRTIEATGEILIDRLYQGIPRGAYFDRSGSHQSQATEEVLTNLNVKLILGHDEFDGEGMKTGRSNKKAHGKIERNQGDLKRGFEQLASDRIGFGKRIPIHELQEMYLEWMREKNMRYHPRREGKRWEIFEPHVMSARFPEETAFALLTTSFTRKVRKDRTINVGKNLFAIAPEFIRINATVEIIPEAGSYYLKHEGVRHLLAMQNTVTSDERNERPSDVLQETQLRERMDAELAAISDGNVSIKKAKHTHGDDLAFFFEKARTIEELKNLARIIVSEINKPRHPNVIIANV